ncbi:MAG TPA: hypothetical protein VGR71_04410 [Nitrospira sp.]|nr:hypothetical protein [Nitrospira sp.]
MSTNDSENFLDAWNELNGGVSSLLRSDLVMDELAKISLDEGVTAADVVTGIARNVADISVLLNKEMRKE